MINLICDKCSGEFELKQKEIIDGKYKVRYFCCPHCKKISITHVEDAALRKSLKLYRAAGISKDQLRVAEYKTTMAFLRERGAK